MKDKVEVFGAIKEGDLVAEKGSEELQEQSRVHAIEKPAVSSENKG